MTSKFDKSQEMQRKSHRLIPGGAHTYAKGDDQYPLRAPGFIARGQGCHVWDVDGNEYIEYGMGLRAVSLGHAYPRVVAAAHEQMLLGNNFTRPSPIELELAETMLELVEAADMVKFAKNGSDVTTAAVKLARAHTGRDKVAFCRDQPFFSTDDWFIGGTAMNRGVPRAVRELSLGFRFNDTDSVRALFEEHPGQIACLMLEPAKETPPAGGFLQDVQRLCRENGALLIFDEMITGFRLDLRGAQHLYGVAPDLSTFGKAMANGFAVAALLGRRDVMELGGLDHGGERVFLLSTTHGAENHALAAALETIATYREEDVIGHLARQGTRLAVGIQDRVEALGLGEHFRVAGPPSNLVYATLDRNKAPSQAFRTLFLQETIKRGVLAPSLVVSHSHADSDIDATIERVGGALEVYRRALEEGIENYLVGRPVKPVMRAFN